MRRAATPAPPTTGPAPRSAWRLLADPVFGPFFFGKVLATSGIWVHNIVAAILAYELSGSALVVGAVSVAQFGPQLLLAPLSGAAADHGDRRRQLVLGRLIAVLGSGGLALALWVLGPDGLPGAWPVVLAAGMVGVGFVIGGPAMNALIPSMVRHNELATGVGLNIVPPTIARAAGPAIGALLATAASPAAAFTLAALANLAFAIVLMRLRIPERPRDRSGDRRVRAALRYLREDRGIAVLLVGVTAIGVGADPVITLTPSLAATFDAGGELVGTFASSFGIGAGTAFLAFGAARRRLGLPRVGVAGLLLMATGIGSAGLVPVAELAIAAFVLGGAGMMLSLTSLSTSLQERLPEELRGRVMALWSVAFLGSRPVAAAVNGAVADATSTTVALLVVAALIVAAAVWVRPGRLATRPAPGTPGATTPPGAVG